MTRLPCTECRKRKQTEAELKTLKSDYAKLEKRMAHRLHKIGDLQDTVRRLRDSVKALRKMERRLTDRYEDLHEQNEQTRLALRTLRLNIRRALED